MSQFFVWWGALARQKDRTASGGGEGDSEHTKYNVHIDNTHTTCTCIDRQASASRLVHSVDQEQRAVNDAR